MRRKTFPRGNASTSLPDCVTKDGESGAGYWIEVPGADAPLEGWSELTTDVEKTYFVEYLRLCSRFWRLPRHRPPYGPPKARPRPPDGRISP